MLVALEQRTEETRIEDHRARIVPGVMRSTTRAGPRRRPSALRPAVSIVYTTHRQQPLFHWFVDGLVRQLDDDDHVQLVMVDGLANDARRATFEETVDGRFELVYAAAKPTAFNGPFQRTARPLFAAASARNTGIVYASHAYIAFVDDCIVPMPGWWGAVREAARHQYVVAGAFQRHSDMCVSNGVLRTSRLLASGRDTRWALGDDRRVVPIAGGQLYTMSMGAPRHVLVEVNGFDELCDGIGGEDYQVGIRLELAGHLVFYSRTMMTVESEDHQAEDPVQLERVDPVLDEARYHDRLATLGVSCRPTAGQRCDASHMVLDLVHGLGASRAVGNHYDLAALKPADLPSTSQGLPTTFWFDGRRLAEL